jgi:hypothetical protein
MLGDDIERITRSTGIKRVFDNYAKSKGEKKCTPCEKRKKALNNPNILINRIIYNKKK